MASFHQNGQFLRRAKFWLSAATHNLFFLSIFYHLIVLQGWVLFPRWKMAAAFKSVANNQTQISVLRLTSKSSWVWFAIARIKNCNQTFGNEAEKQLCFSFLKSFMVQLSSCIIVAKKSIVLYDWASKELCSSCSLLESSLLRALQSERLERCRTRRSDISVLGANAEFVKMKWIYNSIIIFQLVCCCSLVLCWIFLSTFSLNKFHRWDQIPH